MSITTDNESAVVEAAPNQLFIGGEWRDASGGATLPVEDPSTGETLVEVADATPEDAKAALDAAVAVQDEWAAHPPRERGEILRRAFEAMTARADELALLMTLEMGKPLAESQAEIFEESGLPAGVLSVITSSSSSGVSKPIIEDPRLRKLTFTGSTEVGRKLVEQSAQGLLRTSMELGGNAPFIVFADADVDAAVEGAVIAKMRNIGEACTAANRFHVAGAVEDEFATKLAEKLGSMKVGRGTEDDVKVGPLIDGDQRDKVSELVRDATAKGAQAVIGGSARDGAGYFYEPTVL